MTKQKALNKLKETRVLSTDIIESLDVPFEHWLRFAQFPPDRVQPSIDRLIAREEKKVVNE
tara:strand:- start:239 stop:421 length:183 start_codon:yes stop_codon:yes gene_type:complete